MCFICENKKHSLMVCRCIHTEPYRTQIAQPKKHLYLITRGNSFFLYSKFFLYNKMCFSGDCFVISVVFGCSINYYLVVFILENRFNKKPRPV